MEIIEAQHMHDALKNAYTTPLSILPFNREFRDYLIEELVPPMPRGQVALAAAVTFVERVFEEREKDIIDAHLSEGLQAAILYLCLDGINERYPDANVPLLTSTNYDGAEVRELGVRHIFEGVNIVSGGPIPTIADYAKLGIEIGKEIFDAWNTLDPTQKEESVIGWKPNAHSESS